MVHRQMQLNIKEYQFIPPFNSPQLERPRAVVLEQSAKKNIDRFVNKAKNLGCEFRPHFKTHQSAEIGKWFKETGVNGITVTSVAMAQYFADHGWDDITIAFPFFPGQIDGVNRLLEKSKLRLLVTNSGIVKWLDKNLDKNADIMIEINAGYDRSGISIKEKSEIKEIVNSIHKTEKLNFSGFYIHDGATYKVDSENEIENVLSRDLSAFSVLKKDYPDVKYGLGDTPSCSVLDDFGPANELSPGNFIFFDLMQYKIGSCSLDDIALLVKVPIAQIKPENDQIIIHGGAAHLSKDYILENGKPIYGKPVYFDDEQKIQLIDESSVVSLSQEHGIISGAGALLPHINDDHSIWICPVHSCLTANLFTEYYSADNHKINKRILS